MKKIFLPRVGFFLVIAAGQGPSQLPLGPFPGGGEAGKPAIGPQGKTAEVESKAPGGGTVAGVVKFLGKPPKSGKLEITTDKEVCGKHDIYREDLLVDPKTRGLRNVFVEIKGAGKNKYDGKTKYVLDQRSCVFIPHVLVVPPKAVIDIKNTDSVLHNVRASPKMNRSFNLSIVANKSVKQKVIRPDKIRILCDVHRWMTAWIIVSKSRFHALTDSGGRFEIRGIPAGKYEVSFWHETLGKGKAEVRVEVGGRAKLDFGYKGRPRPR